MRILSVTAQKPGSTGSGVFLAELVKEYALGGHKQAVVAGVCEDDRVDFPEGVVFYPVYFETERLDFPIVGMSDEMPYRSTRYCDMTPEMVEAFQNTFLETIEKAVEEFDPEVILCHHLYLLTAFVREHFPDRLVYGFCHNTDLRQMLKTDLAREYIAEQIRKLDRIFVLQEAQRETAAKIYQVDMKKTTVIGMGYNSKIFYPSDRCVSDGVTRLIFAGKIAEKKGVMSLIRSLSLLPYQDEELELYLAGGAGNEKEYEEITNLAKMCPYKVTFLGKLLQPDLAKMYNTCDIFVLPSFFEGLPLTAIEALSCGDRVVMTDIPGIRDWLDEYAPGADIRYVALPEMRNTDEPVAEALPEFERELAKVLEECIEAGETKTADVSRISWERIALEVLKEDEIRKK